MNDYELFKKLLNEEKKESALDKVIKHARNFWWIYVVCVLTLGILSLFITALVFDKDITVSIMNSWVGVILGLVAMVIGVISMFLSFYNLDQSIKTQKETINKIEEIKKEIIDFVEKRFDKTIEEIHNNGSQKPEIMKPKGEWDNVK